MANSKHIEKDSVYFLKILLYFVLGTIWIKYNGKTIFPIGLVIGALFTSKEHFRIDRKIEYAILLISTIMGLIGLGIFLSL